MRREAAVNRANARELKEERGCGSDDRLLVKSHGCTNVSEFGLN
jgi:hypothetical protein